MAGHMPQLARNGRGTDCRRRKCLQGLLVTAHRLQLTWGHRYHAVWLLADRSGLANFAYLRVVCTWLHPLQRVALQDRILPFLETTQASRVGQEIEKIAGSDDSSACATVVALVIYEASHLSGNGKEAAEDMLRQGILTSQQVRKAIGVLVLHCRSVLHPPSI